jgi:threonine dehydratase
MNADIAEAERASAAALEAAQQEHVKLKRQLDDRVISSGLRDALARHGVNPKIAAGAAAHFRTEYKPAATEDQRVVVMLNGGEVDLDHAVSTWLHSDIGCAFAQRTPVTATNKFTAALRRVTGG